MLHIAKLIQRRFEERPLHPATFWMLGGSALLLLTGAALLLVR